nr:YchJ family metal-binding protein [Nannocystis sp.]
MADDVVLVARDVVAAGDVADEVGRLLDQVGVPGVLLAEAGVLDADGEVVAAGALELGELAPVEAVLVLGGDVPGLVGLLDQLRDLRAVLLDDIVGADARLGLGEPAPAAGVGALAGVDDDDLRRAGGAGGALAEVARAAPGGAGVVGVGGEHGLAVGAGIVGDDAALGLDLGDDVAGEVGDDEAVADQGVDVLVDVADGGGGLGLDARELGDRRGPRAEVLAVDLGEVGLLAQDRGGGADVERAGGLDRVRLDVQQLGAAGEVLAAQGHGAEGRVDAVELDLADDHLPLRLDVADGLEHVDRDVELGGRCLELGLDALEVHAGVGLRGIGGLGHVLDAVAAAVVLGAVAGVFTRAGEQAESCEGAESAEGKRGTPHCVPLYRSAAIATRGAAARSGVHVGAAADPWGRRKARESAARPGCSGGRAPRGARLWQAGGVPRCPCGRPLALSRCCGRFLAGAAWPETAEELMRSRYTAYVQGKVDYVIATTAARGRLAIDRDELLAYCQHLRGVSLAVVETLAGGPADASGVVGFVATLRVQGRKQVQRERSRFAREGGRWVYVDGDVLA